MADMSFMVPLYFWPVFHCPVRQANRRPGLACSELLPDCNLIFPGPAKDIPEVIMSLLLIVLLVLLLAGGGFGYSRYGAVGGSGIVGTILIVILVLYLLGALGAGHA
jgi:hypothetical protein